MKNTITIFTDGAARGNPGPGGWGAIVATSEKVVELGGGDKHTTNNRMELSAVIEALSYAKKLKINSIIVHLDSSYVMKGATTWIFGWQKNNWKTKTKDDVLNRDLWEKLAKLLPLFKIEWKLLPGHSGIPGNERCDVISTSFADGEKLKLYSGTPEKYSVDLSSLTATKSKPKKSKSNGAKAYSYVSQVKGVTKVHATWAECEKRVKGVSGTRFKKSFSPEDERTIIASWQAH